MQFRNRTAVITGAGGGIGRAVCRKLHEYGVRIAACDITKEIAEKAVAENGTDVRAYAVDVTSAESVGKTSEEILQDFGNIDILVNNAGVWRFHRFTETAEKDWHEILEINLCGTIRMTRAFLPSMKENGYGRIINLGSIAGEVGLPGYFDYSASKAGIIALTKALAMEFGSSGITVNCVSPGQITNQDGPGRPHQGTWVGREGSRDEVADLIRFLAADDSSFITGVDYTIDGGRILGPKQTDPNIK